MTDLAEAFRKVSAAGLMAAIFPARSIRKAGAGSEAQMTPGTGYGAR